MNVWKVIMAYKNDNKVNLLTEKSRKVIDDIPQSGVRWGMALIIFSLITLLAAVIFIPYPYSRGESILQHLFGNYQ